MSSAAVVFSLCYEDVYIFCIGFVNFMLLVPENVGVNSLLMTSLSSLIRGLQLLSAFNSCIIVFCPR